MIIQQLEKVCHQLNAWPGLYQAMLSLLTSDNPTSKNVEEHFKKWISFPGLCCQSVGGQAEWANDLAAAWMLFFYSANIMDVVEDGDKPEPAWAGLSQGMIVNAASGLYFSASVILENLHKHPVVGIAAKEIILDFYRSFYEICSGQHQDLSTPRPSLVEYWEIASRKSGAFFAIPCRLGARLSINEPERLKGFHNFGWQIGLMIQILDDIADIRKAPEAEDWNGLYKSLPVIYALQSDSPHVRTCIAELLQSSSPNHEEGERLLDLIDESGAVQYLLSIYEDHKKKALSALNQARPLRKFKEELLAYLPPIR